MKLTDLLALSHVPRWSIVPRIKEQTVADHTFRVMAILVEIRDRLLLAPNSIDGGTALRWALMHDGEESRTADIPGVFKRRLGTAVVDTIQDICPWMNDENWLPDTAAKHLVKLADLIETFTWIRKWGHGPHAEQVAHYVWRDLRAQYTMLSRPPYNYVDIGAHAEEICSAIINDVDREPRWSSQISLPLSFRTSGTE